MSIFGTIMSKIFHHAPAATAAPAQKPAATPAPAPVAAPATAPAEAVSVQGVDVGAVLSAMASMKDGGGDYQRSIVELLKLLDLDSSLAARKELANELGVHEAEDGSAEQNIALHKAVIAKLAENGGVVPDKLRN